MREVQAHEVRAICEAGGEVTDKDGDVWSFRDGEFGVDLGGRTWIAPCFTMHHDAPFRVTKEPPTVQPAEPTSFASKREALAWMAQNPGRRVHVAGDDYNYFVNARGDVCADLKSGGETTADWSHSSVNGPFTVVPLDPLKPATDEELAAWLERTARELEDQAVVEKEEDRIKSMYRCEYTAGAYHRIAEVIRTRRLP